MSISRSGDRRAGDRRGGGFLRLGFQGFVTRATRVARVERRGGGDGAKPPSGSLGNLVVLPLAPATETAANQPILVRAFGFPGALRGGGERGGSVVVERQHLTRQRRHLVGRGGVE